MAKVLAALTNRRIFFVLLMGFASGIPLALTGGTLQAWMKSESIDLKTIGIFSLVGFPYSFKYIWAPLLDRFTLLPLGRRRGWMLLSQIALIGLVLAMAFSNPGDNLALFATLAVCVAFFSASQDIVIDAYRVEILQKEELGVGASVAILGYRLGMLTSGALALILSDHFSWRTVYCTMAGALSIGVIASLFSPEPSGEIARPRTLLDAVIRPFIEYFKRPAAFEILAFVLLYKLGDVMAAALTTPFMIELGFSRTEIGAVTKGFGLAATIGGSLFGGALMVKIGMKRSLWMFGFLQAITILCFALLAWLGKSYGAMTVSIALENMTAGMGTAAFTAFLMSLCNRNFTATQYALLTSLMSVTRILAGAPTGYIVQQIGWCSFFVVCTLAAIPGLLLLLRYDRWVMSSTN